MPESELLSGTSDSPLAPPGFDVFTVGSGSGAGSIALPRISSATIPVLGSGSGSSLTQFAPSLALLTMSAFGSPASVLHPPSHSVVMEKQSNGTYARSSFIRVLPPAHLGPDLGSATCGARVLQVFHSNPMQRLFPLTLLACCGLVSCGSADELPEILVVSDFELTDHHGQRFASDRLDGHVWIASFVFTSCRDVCPLLTNQVANLHRRVSQPEVRFVSVSVDPEVDTPERLAEYAGRYGADERWVFLTGEPREVRRVVTQILRVAMGERNDVAGGYDIAHSEQLLLVDARGVLRGAYDTDRDGMRRLEEHIERLLGE